MKTFSSTNVLTTHISYTTGKEAGISNTASEQTERLDSVRDRLPVFLLALSLTLAIHLFTRVISNVLS